MPQSHALRPLRRRLAAGSRRPLALVLALAASLVAPAAGRAADTVTVQPTSVDDAKEVGRASCRERVLTDV